MVETLGLKSKLALIWGIKKVKMHAIGNRFYNIFLESTSDQSTIMSIGTININPQIFHVAQWCEDFNPWSQ